MKYAVWILVIALVVLHHDFWFWNDERLVFGFLPVGLFYHACLSAVTGVVWFLATRFAWPESLEVESDSLKESPSNPGGEA